MSKTGETVQFFYNDEGLRVRKVSTSGGTTDYTLHGKQVMHLKNGTNELHFYYGSNGKPAFQHVLCYTLDTKGKPCLSGVTCSIETKYDVHAGKQYGAVQNKPLSEHEISVSMCA